MCVLVKLNKRSFEVFVFGSFFRTLAVILFQIIIFILACLDFREQPCYVPLQVTGDRQNPPMVIGMGGGGGGGGSCVHMR